MFSAKEFQYPTREEAEQLIEWGESQNAGQWGEHCRVVARAAETIAASCELNQEIAYVFGLLHDIGRYEGNRALHHVIAGYTFMKEKGYLKNAEICMTHSFPIKDIDVFSGKNDCNSDETEFIKTMLINIEYDDYHKLIQLCDAIGLPEGVCLLDVRLMDVVRRHGFNAYTLQKWEAFYDIKSYFDQKCGRNLYDLFYDEIREVSFR